LGVGNGVAPQPVRTSSAVKERATDDRNTIWQPRNEGVYMGLIVRPRRAGIMYAH
jgi:hypothetical protein